MNKKDFRNLMDVLLAGGFIFGGLWLHIDMMVFVGMFFMMLYILLDKLNEILDELKEYKIKKEATF